jgi:hypothetical protein
VPGHVGDLIDHHHRTINRHRAGRGRKAETKFCQALFVSHEPVMDQEVAPGKQSPRWVFPMLRPDTSGPQMRTPRPSTHDPIEIGLRFRAPRQAA